MGRLIKLFRSLLRSVMLLLNLLVVIWLFLCKYASMQEPETPTILSLFSYSTIFAFFVNIFFVFYWLLTSKKWRSLISLLAILSLSSFLRPLFGFNYLSSNKMNPEDGNVKVMTWNVHLFDLGAWAKDDAARAKMISLIKKENPDILCLQEFYRESRDVEQPYVDVIRNLGYPYLAFAKQFTGWKRRITINASKGETIDIGNIVFSKFPLDNSRVLDLGVVHHSLLAVDAKVDEKRWVTVNVFHLTSVNFEEKDMEYIDSFKTKGIVKKDKNKAFSLVRKLTHSAAERAVLANRIDSLKRFMDHPLIVCGDFNDVPSSYVYQTVKGSLGDPFATKGVGFGRTFKDISPTLRIDYIFYDKDALKVIGYDRRIENLSDHFPVIANFRFKK